MHVVLALTALLSLPADPPSPAEARLETHGVEYRPAEEVLYTLTNGGDRPLGYNLCLVVVERRDADGRWERAAEQPDRICRLELRVLDPGEETSESLRLGRGLTPGSYRLRTMIHPSTDGRPIPITSNPFRVRS